MTFVVGGILALTGVIGYVVSGAESWTALIPAIIGVIFLIVGFIARNEKFRRHAIHGVLVVALLGLAGTFMNVMKIGTLFDGSAERPLAVISSTITFVVLLVYIAFGVNSFIQARRNKRAAVTS
nr:hypothetical protein [Pseudoclavibacter chungangensis]